MHQAASALALRAEPYGSPGPRWVVARAEAELVSRYGALDAGELDLTADMFDPPCGTFLVARAEGHAEPVGGVGVRTVAEGVGQVRRLWVDPNRRGLGIGRALMTGLEVAARRLGLTALILATGDRQPEAVALYETSGWERVSVNTDGSPLPQCFLRFAKAIV